MADDDQRGDDPTKTWSGELPSRVPEDRQHPAHEGRIIDRHGNFQPQREFTGEEIEAALNWLRKRKRDRGEEPNF
jgi:hypothetical protein